MAGFGSLAPDYRSMNQLVQPLPGQASLNSYQPTAREQITDWLSRNWYGDNRQGQQKADRLMGVADMTPFGLAPQMYDAGRAAGNGNIGEAALNLGIMALPMPAGAKQEAKQSIRAFHGSPHNFDAFDMSRIGTGEGAQAYGHGLYFADNEGVARSYRDALSGSTGNAQHTMLRKVMAAVPQERVVSAMQRIYPDMTAAGVERIKKEMETAPSPGKMYEVNINADPNHFLDWDKPLSEQPEYIKQIFGKIGSAQKNRPLKETDIGRELYFKQTQGLTNDSGSERLKEAGVPGIKYLDQGSRTKGDGSRNYVVFDDKLVSILRKYGLIGMLGGGSAASLGSLNPDQAQAAQ